MKSTSALKGLILALSLTAPAWSAPLFPDVPENHWARDAVASLAAKGLIEGYPDAYFKGDRQASRWELAAATARLLSKLENDHATLATKAELEELNKLAAALRGELEALGARVGRLEEQVQLLDARVSEMERISFYGEYKARITTASMRNTGLGSLGNPAIIEYNDAVGSNTGAGGVIPPPSPAAGMTFNTFVFGIMSVTDWSNGRPMVSGSSIGQTLMLGTRIRMTDDLDCGAEFSAYSSCGNNVMDAFWGVGQPYLNNPFTAATVCEKDPQGLNHNPYIKMALDNFWMEHKPSQTKLVLGSFNEDNFDPLVYVGQRNPNAWDDRYLNSYGLLLSGQSDLGEDAKIKWQVMGTALADGAVNSLFPDRFYQTRAQGVNAELLFAEERGSFKLNFLHAANDCDDGSPLQGLIAATNYTLEWVNPDGYYVNQLGGPGNSQTAGMGSHSDVRPISMAPGVGNDGYTGIPRVPNVGAIGPQDMLNYGVSAKYDFDCETVKPGLFLEYAHTDYKPSKNSDYKVGGDAYRGGLNLNAFDDALKLEVTYQSTDPTYDPFILNYPEINGIGNTLWHVPCFTYYNSLYSLHDTDVYTHNRRGWKGKLDWKFCPTGLVSFSYSDYNQVKTSCQDVRYSAGCLGPGTPNGDVIGYSPGFMDPVFGGFSPETFAPDADGNAYGKVLENPRGHVQNWSIRAGFKYPLEYPKNKRCIGISGGAVSTHFTRHSNLSNMLTTPTRWGAESQNYVNCYLDSWQISLDYDISTNTRMNIGYKSIDIYGHMDHLGVMNAYANDIQSSDFDVLNMEQRIPNISVEWDITDQMTWGALGRFYYTKDRMREDIYSSPGIPALNINFGPQQGAHPFNWQGYMISTYLNFKF